MRCFYKKVRSRGHTPGGQWPRPCLRGPGFPPPWLPAAGSYRCTLPAAGFFWGLWPLLGQSGLLGAPRWPHGPHGLWALKPPETLSRTQNINFTRP
jgi:hypothetical protein